MSTLIATTNGYEVEVESRYVPEQSDPTERQYFFAYTIIIRNIDGQKAQLLNRHWIITDGWGRIEEVKGPGVIGKHPHLDKGESFSYTSFCPLATSTGTMQGSYRMRAEDGTEFDIEIPQFFLFEPSSMN